MFYFVRLRSRSMLLCGHAQFATSVPSRAKKSTQHTHTLRPCGIAISLSVCCLPDALCVRQSVTAPQQTLRVRVCRTRGCMCTRVCCECMCACVSCLTRTRPGHDCRTWIGCDSSQLTKAVCYNFCQQRNS